MTEIKASKQKEMQYLLLWLTFKHAQIECSGLFFVIHSSVYLSHINTQIPLSLLILYCFVNLFNLLKPYMMDKKKEKIE